MFLFRGAPLIPLGSIFVVVVETPQPLSLNSGFITPVLAKTIEEFANSSVKGQSPDALEID